MRRLFGWIAVGCLLVLFFWSLSGELVGLPRHLQVTSGDVKKLNTRLPVAVDLKGGGDVAAVAAGANERGVWRSTVTLSARGAGEASLVARLFGVVTLPPSRVEVLPSVKVMPGGDAIGVLLAPYGMAVMSFAAVTGLDGRQYHPARDAGLREGDIILAVNGERVFSAQQISSLINAHGRAGEAVRLKIRRGKEEMEIVVRPVASGLAHPTGSGFRGRAEEWPPDSSRGPLNYLIGVYVQEPAAGVGTITFYHRQTGIYSALGHMIVDPATRKPRDVSQATVVAAQIADIEPGKEGRPGEKIGAFRTSQPPLGRIARNTEYGIYGQVLYAPRSWGERKEIPVALADEVHEGPAVIRTVIAGELVEEFAVEITRVYRQRRPDGKGLILRVTDDRLLSATGGIVQGMSGSPIIQDGKLAGAVTHVFVNDPRQGYGMLAEWMAKAAGLYDPRTGLVRASWPERVPVKSSTEVVPEWAHASLAAFGEYRSRYL